MSQEEYYNKIEQSNIEMDPSIMDLLYSLDGNVIELISQINIGEKLISLTWRNGISEGRRTNIVWDIDIYDKSIMVTKIYLDSDFRISNHNTIFDFVVSEKKNVENEIMLMYYHIGEYNKILFRKSKGNKFIVAIILILLIIAIGILF